MLVTCTQLTLASCIIARMTAQRHRVYERNILLLNKILLYLFYSDNYIYYLDNNYSISNLFYLEIKYVLLLNNIISK